MNKNTNLNCKKIVSYKLNKMNKMDGFEGMN